ncbi:MULTISPECIES: hypothetical protein [unclassified Micromonospora]|uniref:hypothetical protein n=1 Tax=unclassified Micromonospora TaxID=2617518 RepID=UPI00098D5D70|nr:MULTISPECIES: hypothetical protein [unclassified Micromonospora]MDI5937072.1 hypothetical protein [Micromonospora sp. DH15]OON30167.1 hypothetical protein BSA16_17670 [Micromonospora sp. Rc5]
MSTRLQIGSGPETIRVLKAALVDGLLPDTYVSAGSLVHMEAVSGGLPTAADEDSPLPISASALNPAGLAGLLAEHAYVYKVKTRKTDGGNPEMYEDEVTPPRDILSSVLAGKTWPGVPPLRGIIGAPVLRRDGTLLQQPGYDPQTGLYLAAKVALPPVPDQPTPEQVRDARTFLLGRFLRDFPWASAADRANYVALLATPILRHFTRSLTPFALIDATMPSSGKTILTAGPGMLYGQRVMTWAYSDEELRKSITAVLAEQVGVVIWDNLAEGTVIDSPVLAQLVTSGVWSDRQLGASRNVATVNDRLWMATGNNLQVGGDMASRTVRVHLDPDMPRPELRDQAGFGIPHLDQWITDPANQLTVLWHLLVLVLDWTRQGAPRVSGLSMRQFTPWAQALGGFLHHHGIDGFLTNAADVREIDEDETRWRAFLTCWHDRHGARAMTAADLRRDAEPMQIGSDINDPWDGQFITTHNGRLPNPLQLGRLLTGQAGRWRGEHVVRAGKNDRGDRSVFWVEHHQG